MSLASLKNSSQHHYSSSLTEQTTDMGPVAPSPADTIPSIPLRSSSVIPSVSQPIIPKSLFSAPSISEPILPSKSLSSPSSLSLSVPTASASIRQLPSPPPSPMNNPSNYPMYHSQATSRCSSMNSTSSFSSSLDHRSMARANSTKRNKSQVHLPVTQQQQNEQQQRLPAYEKPLPRVPNVTFPTPPNYQTKEQRAAFLSSAPVRSQVTISQRNKNLTPVSTSLASKSTPSFFTSSLSASTLHLNMGSYHSTTDVIAEKRRRSGDSMKDPKDSEWLPATTVTSPASSSFPSVPLPSSPVLNSSASKYFSDDEEDEYDAYELETPNAPSTTTLNDSYFNVERNYSALMSQDKKSKKKCRLFGFITKK